MTAGTLVAAKAASPDPPRRKGPRQLDWRKRESKLAYVFLAPWILGTVCFFAGPLLLSLAMSFTDWSLLKAPKFVGFDNYQRMFSEDYRFWDSLRITGAYLVLSVPLYLVLGLAAALLLNQRVWGIRMFRTILFMPSVLSGVAVAVLWMQMLNPEGGAVNTLLRHVGVESPPGWFADSDWAVPAIVLVGMWEIVGHGAIIYLAGLQNIPPAFYEAAEIDGAGTWRRFRSITIPLLTPTLFFMLLMSLIKAMQMFDTAYTIGGASDGGTGDSLLFYLPFVYRAGFADGELGYAAALSWFLLLVGAVIIVALMRTSNRWVHED